MLGSDKWSKTPPLEGGEGRVMGNEETKEIQLSWILMFDADKEADRSTITKVLEEQGFTRLQKSVFSRLCDGDSKLKVANTIAGLQAQLPHMELSLVLGEIFDLNSKVAPNDNIFTHHIMLDRIIERWSSAAK